MEEWLVIIQQISLIFLGSADSWVNYILKISFITYALHMTILLNIAFCSDWHFSVPDFFCTNNIICFHIKRHFYQHFVNPRLYNQHRNLHIIVLSSMLALLCLHLEQIQDMEPLHDNRY